MTLEEKRSALKSMKNISNDAVETGPPLTVGRTGLSAFLLALLRPGDAKGVTLHSNDVTLDLLSKSLSISFGQIEKIDVKRAGLGIPFGCASPTPRKRFPA